MTIYSFVILTLSLSLSQFIQSCVEGISKPDPAIYQRALDMLGTEGRETLFLDDIGNNLKGAANFGIITIKVLPYMGQVYECVLRSKHSYS